MNGKPRITTNLGKATNNKGRDQNRKEKKKKKEMEGDDWGSEHPDRLNNISEYVCEDASGWG